MAIYIKYFKEKMLFPDYILRPAGKFVTRSEEFILYFQLVAKTLQDKVKDRIHFPWS